MYRESVSKQGQRAKPQASSKQPFDIEARLQFRASVLLRRNYFFGSIQPIVLPSESVICRVTGSGPSHFHMLRIMSCITMPVISNSNAQQTRPTMFHAEYGASGTTGAVINAAPAATPPAGDKLPIVGPS